MTERNSLYILPIEPIENRYPGHWHQFMQKQFIDFIDENDLPFEVYNINGEYKKSNSGTSAFLNFIDTNVWKSEQMKQVALWFAAGGVRDGDVFLITDAWNPAVHQLRYMADLTGVDICIVGVWHAGSYDRWDILGQTFPNKKWSYKVEASMYEAYDTNIFATEFHRNMFEDVMRKAGESITPWKSVVCGFPMEYMQNGSLKEFAIQARKENMVIFPHRKSPEKQHDIAEDLSEALAEKGIEMYICQGKGLTTTEYHAKLAQAKVVFSASWQETLGIAQFEGMLHGAIPLQPNRLSYTEMYDPTFNYPSLWTENFELYKFYKNDLVDHIENMVLGYDHYTDLLEGNAQEIFEKFFTGTKFYATVLTRR